MYRTLLVALVALALLASGAANDVQAQITTRTQEPIVIRASSMPAFGGADITKILLYKRTATGWQIIPSQIDEFTNDPLKTHLSGACVQDVPTCERAVRLSGAEADGFSGTDELVFMARDSGQSALTSDWAVTGTASYRYQITLHDTVGSQYATVYAYVWTDATSPPIQSTDYVTWTTDSSNGQCIGQMDSPPFVDPACGWLRSTDQGSQAALPRFNFFQSGNWTMGAMCIKPYATDANCTVVDPLQNILDQFKWRTTVPTERERGWDRNCRAFIGVKDGVVRVVRRIIGAASGSFTTKTEYFYGTWLDQLINLRVHPIGSITMWMDHRPKDFPNPETPGVIFTKAHSNLNNGLSMDAIDNIAPATVTGNFLDWIQVDTSRGTYVQLVEERRTIRDATATFEYEDGFGGGYQYVAGERGQHGFKWAGSPGPCIADTQDFACPENPETSPDLQFASTLRSLVPLAVDGLTGIDPAYRSEEGAIYQSYRSSPIIVSVVREDFTGTRPPVGFCTPTLSGTVNAGAYSNSLVASTSACASQDAAGVQIYRGTVPGIYTLLEDLGKSTSHFDPRIKSGVTYRYVARAYNANGDLGATSAELVLTPVDTVAPPVPVGLTAVPGSRKVIVSWTPATDRDTSALVVHLATSAGGPYSPVNLADPIVCGAVTFAVVNLTAGQPYWFRVTAKDPHGNESAYSAEVNATPLN